MKRPLAYTALVFVIVLFLLQIGEKIGVFNEPVAGVSDELRNLYDYNQGDTIVVCGEISDYSIEEKYGRTTTELILKNIQILPQSEDITKENHFRFIHEESDYLSHFQSIGKKGQCIIAYMQEDFCPVIGKQIIFCGELSFWKKATNPGEFDAYKFYTNRGILFSVKKARVLKESVTGRKILQGLKEFRLQQEAFLEEYLPDGNDAIMKAMLFGNRKEMDEETKELYQRNGIAHILAISGLHISLLGMTIYKMFLHLPVPKWCILSVSGCLLVLYCFMVGISASAFRALVMFSFFLISKWLKRSYDMITAMAFAAMAWLFVHPGYLFDCGFQLSYAAIMGMGIILPVLTEIADSVKIKRLRRIIVLFLPSLSVNLMTAPILIYHYHELSFFSIVLNLIVLPLMAPLLLCGIGMLFMANLFGGINVLPAKVCAIPVNFILWIYEMGCRLLELAKIGRRNIAPLQIRELILYYSILFVMTLLVKKKSHIYQFLFPIACIFLLIIPSKPDFSIWTLDVGQGDCNVIFTKEGNTFIIDCGSTSKYNVGERILIPFLKYHGVGSVDGVIVSHPDEDHMNGVLELLHLGETENIEIGGVYIYEKGRQSQAQEWKELLDLAEVNEVPVYNIGQGDILQTATLQMKCLYPLEEQEGLIGNASSLVMSVKCGDFCGLFTGDLEMEGEKQLRQEYEAEEVFGENEKCDLLKVAHHGSSTSTGSLFLQWLNPENAVISCGENNRYGHPHKEVLSRLAAEEIPYRITCEEGAINWITNTRHP